MSCTCSHCLCLGDDSYTAAAVKQVRPNYKVPQTSLSLTAVAVCRCGMASLGGIVVVSLAQEYGMDIDGPVTFEEACLRVENCKFAPP
jgi:hypothetical protein